MVRLTLEIWEESLQLRLIGSVWGLGFRFLGFSLGLRVQGVTSLYIGLVLLRETVP